MKEPYAAVHLGNLQKVLQSAKEEPHGAGSPEGLSGTGNQEPASCDEQGEVTSAPPLCSGHHTHPCLQRPWEKAGPSTEQGG